MKRDFRQSYISYSKVTSVGRNVLQFMCKTRLIYRMCLHIITLLRFESFLFLIISFFLFFQLEVSMVGFIRINFHLFTRWMQLAQGWNSLFFTFKMLLVMSASSSIECNSNEINDCIYQETTKYNNVCRQKWQESDDNKINCTSSEENDTFCHQIKFNFQFVILIFVAGVF